MPKPFLKWAGSKKKLLRELLPHFPQSFNTYYEPFLGSGAAFFAIEPKRAVLSDSAPDLISTYKAISTDVDAVIRQLRRLAPDKETFYAVRKNRSQDKYKRAAEFIYLNKTCWNGLYRVNLKGEFNVPFGLQKGQYRVDFEGLRTSAAKLANRGIKILNADFSSAVASAKPGDFVYFDPPYVTKHNNNGFAEWNDKIFSWADQERLAELASALLRSGVQVVISNAYHKDIIQLYGEFKAIEILRNSTLASDRSKRTIVSELILVGNQRDRLGKTVNGRKCSTRPTNKN